MIKSAEHIFQFDIDDLDADNSLLIPNHFTNFTVSMQSNNSWRVISNLQILETNDSHFKIYANEFANPNNQFILTLTPNTQSGTKGNKGNDFIDLIPILQTLNLTRSSIHQSTIQNKEIDTAQNLGVSTTNLSNQNIYILKYHIFEHDVFPNIKAFSPQNPSNYIACIDFQNDLYPQNDLNIFKAQMIFSPLNKTVYSTCFIPLNENGEMIFLSSSSSETSSAESDSSSSENAIASAYRMVFEIPEDIYDSLKAYNEWKWRCTYSCHMEEEDYIWYPWSEWIEMKWNEIPSAPSFIEVLKKS